MIDLIFSDKNWYFMSMHSNALRNPNAKQKLNLLEKETVLKRNELFLNIYCL